MTLSVTQPTDQELNARWPYWIRTLAAAINAIVLDPASVTTNNLTIAAGDIALVIGVDLSTTRIEIIFISSIGEAEIEYLRMGLDGQIKVFIAQDDEVSFLDGVKSDGHIYLNQPALTALNMEQDDVLALVNVGGDGDATYGYWKELWRDLSVK
jgi:hypothetical protein